MGRSTPVILLVSEHGLERMSGWTFGAREAPRAMILGISVGDFNTTTLAPVVGFAGPLGNCALAALKPAFVGEDT
jgi:hypothetical protein